MKQKANMRNYGRSVYKERSEQGICTRCGKRKAAPGRKKCKLCLEKDAESTDFLRALSLKVEYKEEKHLCRYCGITA